MAVKRMGFTVTTYTGYKWEHLVQSSYSGVHLLLDNTDILVDGPYVDNLREPGLQWRGSSNQRIIDVHRSLGGSVVLL